MKLHTFPPAPNPTKLRIYLGEKGIEIPVEMVNLVHGEQKTPEFLAMNPFGGVPVLEIEPGIHLRESLAIIEYLEELHPDPPMIGTAPFQRARVRELERTIEIGLMNRVARIVHNTRSPLGLPPDEAAAKKDRDALPTILGYLEERIGDAPFACGEHPTIADCTLFAACRFAEFGGVELDPAYGNVHRWYREFQQRPSAQ